MFEELTLLLDWVDDPSAPRQDYIDAIIYDNCLHKSSVSNRAISARHLTELYGLDPAIALFRAMRHFWQRDVTGRPLLALLCALARDSILHELADRFIQLPFGTVITREDTERWLEELNPGRFSHVTLSSTARNINSTWTQAGYLRGKVIKTRAKAVPTKGAVAHALFLAYLNGSRGTELFQSIYIRVLDCSSHEAIELASEASRYGWITFKRIGDVFEVGFPNMLTPQESEWLREQS